MRNGLICLGVAPIFMGILVTFCGLANVVWECIGPMLIRAGFLGPVVYLGWLLWGIWYLRRLDE